MYVQVNYDGWLIIGRDINGFPPPVTLLKSITEIEVGNGSKARYGWASNVGTQRSTVS